MQQTQKKTIVVVGATGQQGGAVVQALLKEHKDKVNIRGIVRNVNSENALKLQKQGVELVVGDLLNKDSLIKAFQGANSAFLVPIYDYRNMSFPEETQQIKNMADAAKEAKLEHVIYSTLDHAELKAKGKLPEIEGMTVPFYDNKARMDQYFRDLKIPTTYLLTCYYSSNLIHKLGFAKIGDKYALNWNMGDKLLGITILEDLGRIAASILVNKSHINEYIGGVSDFLPIKKMAEILSKALNVQFFYNELTDEQYRKLPFPIAPHLANMFAYQRMFNEEYVAVRKNGSQVIKDLKTYDQWVNENLEALKTIL